ncbi:MAG: hypothetical protein AAGD01_01340 [Acidobacteriota bacterium]
MKRALLVACAACLVLVATPAIAGTAYVPLAVDKTVDGRTFSTELWVTNAGQQRRTLSSLFLEEGTDGSVRDGLEETAQGLPAETTQLLTGVTPDGKAGLLEVSGAPQIKLTGQIRVTDDTGATIATTSMPVVDSDDSIAAGETLSLQGLQRTDAGSFTDIGVVNLEESDIIECVVTLFRVDGTQVGPTLVGNLPPRSLVYLDDAFNLPNIGNLGGARAEVTCDGIFYPYGLVWFQGLQEAQFVAPSASLSSEFLRPGERPPVPTVDLPGGFFNPVVGASLFEVDLPVDKNTPYQRVVVEFDMFLNRWQNPLFHGLVGLKRTNGGPQYFGIFLRGSNSRTIIDRGDGTDVSIDGPWQERTNYSVRLEYNAANGASLNVQVSIGGQVIYNINPAMTFTDLRVAPNQDLRLFMGLSGSFDGGAFLPPWGWNFRNLTVQAFEE